MTPAPFPMLDRTSKPAPAPETPVGLSPKALAYLFARPKRREGVRRVLAEIDALEADLERHGAEIRAQIGRLRDWLDREGEK